MITDERHPEMRRAAEELRRRLYRLTVDRQPSRLMYAEVLACRDEHRQRWRLRGVDFPQMAVVAVPRLQVLELWRADLELPSLRQKVLNLVWAHPAVTAEEVSAALRAAYPGLRPGDLSDEARDELGKRVSSSSSPDGSLRERLRF